ncbi:glycoside hydrolase domain-containing protein [Streptomyces sp. NPDC026206]|uniref:glycoside hydrolase domain-containing protein n=1 Tax=Streptomyces sp. NPDC026206 TaxID=3157089 RepID=UPI0033F88FE2
MADEMVRKAQRFINTVYGNVPGINKVEENGRPGWPTMYALTRCLQYELGITALADNFGPGTLAALTAKWPVIDHSTVPPANIVRIIQSGLYCKGYDGGDIDGTYNDRVRRSVAGLKTDMGVSGVHPGDTITPKVFKALLNMDAYAVTGDGSAQVREIQQWMNGSFVHRRNFFIVPCDGHFSRDVQKALLFAVQYQLGMNDETANGLFGPATREGIKNNPVSTGSTGPFVQLFSAAMVFNKRRGASFTATFTAALSDAVRAFQDFVKLPLTGRGDFQTWASLLVSTGDNTRKGTALDCVTEITPARADALKAAGYEVAGRYLTNVDGASLNKKIQPGELEVIRTKGLRVFPIYQTYGGSSSYFNEDQGTADSLAAFAAASGYGFKSGTYLYFAVDYDAVDQEVTDNIIPHFRGINRQLESLGGKYGVGIYGPRNVCSRVSTAGFATHSFVSDMSAGFSGNLGHSLPENWAFDQIATVSVGSGDGRIEIDNNILSGRDMGQNSFDPVPPQRPDVDFSRTYWPALLRDIRACMESMWVPEKGAIGPSSTTECLENVIHYDRHITSLARKLGIRKALVQAPVLWQLRTATARREVPAAVEAWNGSLGKGAVRLPALEGTSSEIFGALRNSQGSEQARKQLRLYEVFEKYNSILRRR